MFRDDSNDKQKIHIQRIERLTAVVVVLIALESAFLAYSESKSQDSITYNMITMGMILLQGIVLIASVFFLRHEINSVESAHASMKMVRIHVVNFILFAFIMITYATLNHLYLDRTKDGTEDVKALKLRFFERLFVVFSDTCGTYLLLFLLFLNNQFT